jgi:hypothetical protein
MARNPLHKPTIPRRSRVCCRTREKLEPGAEYISLILEGEGEGEYIREDILLSYWQQHPEDELAKRAKSSWKSKIPLKPEAPKEQEEFLERAYEMFLEHHEKTSPEDLLRAFVLALFLQRKKVFIFRQEMQHLDNPAYVFETQGAEDIYCVPAVKPTEEQMKSLQDELSHEIGIVP